MCDYAPSLTIQEPQWPQSSSSRLAELLPARQSRNDCMQGKAILLPGLTRMKALGMGAALHFMNCAEVLLYCSIWGRHMVRGQAERARPIHASSRKLGALSSNDMITEDYIGEQVHFTYPGYPLFDFQTVPSISGSRHRAIADRGEIKIGRAHRTGR